MNPDYIERNTKACENGHFCEDYAKRVVPGLEWEGGLCDARLNGVPVDVKGCEAWYPRRDKPNADKRAGMFTLDYYQQKEIERENGFYFCIVHIGELVVKSFFVQACRIDYHRHAQKQVSWTTMQRLARGVNDKY